MAALPQHIGPYRILEELGRGGQGAVYKGATRSGDVVAVKVLLPQRLAGVGHGVMRFKAEAHSLASLRHPNVVRFLDAGTHEGQPWLAMQWVAGGSLADRLRRGPLAIEHAVELTRQIAEALTYLHTCGVLHRDLKPDNVLLNDERVVLTDFGLALDLDSETRLTTTGQFLGSPGFWAPEQASGDVHSVGPPADVYGLGAVLYMCLTGNLPVSATTLAEFLNAAQDLPPPVAPSRARPEVPAWLEELCLSCLAAEPSKRPTAADVSATIRAEQHPRQAAPRGASLPAVAVVSLLLASTAALGVWWLGSSQSASDAPSALPPVATQTTQNGPQPKPPPATGAQPEPASAGVQQLEDDALRLLETGDSSRAIALLEQALSLEPTRASAFANLGRAKQQGGRLEAAISDYDQALRLDPELHTVHLKRGSVHLQLGNPLAAVSDADAALDLNDQLDLGYLLRAKAQVELGARDAALRDYAQAITLNPRSADALYSQGVLLSELGRFAEAVVSLDQALGISPRWPEALYSRAQAKNLLGNPLGSLEDFNACLALEPEQLDALYGRGVAHSRLGNTQEAIADLERVLSSDPQRADAWVARGSAYAAQGDGARAIDDYRTALRIEPRNVFAHQNLGNVHARRGESAEAAAAYDRAIEVSPSSAQPYVLRAMARIELGEPAAAAEDCRRAARLELSPALRDLLRDAQAKAQAALAGQPPAPPPEPAR